MTSPPLHERMLPRFRSLLDTVRCAAAGISEPTGVLFPDQSVESLVQAVEWFEQERIWRSLDAEAIRAWAERFRPEAFAARFESPLRTAWSAHQRGCAVAASDPAEMSGLHL